MPTLVELRGEIITKSDQLERIFQEAGPELDLTKVSYVDGDTATKAAEIKRRNDELADLGKQLDALREAEDLREKNAERQRWLHEPGQHFVHPRPEAGSGAPGGDLHERAAKSLGTLFTEHPAYLQEKGTAMAHFGVSLPDVDMKTVMTLTAGFAPEATRIPRVVLSAQRRPMVADLIPQDPTTLSAIRYMEETTFTNNAAAVAENAAKPESALAFTERLVPVEVIATTLPVTNQQLDDVPAMQSLIDNRLTVMVQLAEEVELLTGSGTSPHLTGFYNKPSIQTQAKGADPTPDAVFKGMTKVRYTGYADPNGMAIHPNDWQDIRLLRTADGIYIFGSPTDEGIERMWGMPVVVTPAATEGTAILGDFALYSHISRRQGIQIDVSTEHDTFFAYNKVLVRAEERLSLEIYRAAAFCTITGI